MGWDDDVATKQFAWLKLMAGVKYDGYRDFRAGMRFIESLATWLQQFQPGDRATAYEFLRERLVYMGPAEINKLVEQFYPRQVRGQIAERTSASLGVPQHLLYSNPQASAAMKRLLRSTVFMALSDGARLDGVRHSNVGLLSNEQMATATQIDIGKWGDILKELRKDAEVGTEKISQIYLIDDFAGTGTSFFRAKLDDDGVQVIEDGRPKWTGKLKRFHDSVLRANEELEEELLADDWELHVHHYVGTARSAEYLEQAVSQARDALQHACWTEHITLSFGVVLDEEFPLHPPKDSAFLPLTEKYYDSHIEDRHTAVGGVKHMGLGYGGCALPLVLDHNTPNNSVALLWAESEREPLPTEHSMVPLFRRRKRHA